MKKVIIGLVFIASFLGSEIEAGRFGDTFGGTFLGTTGGVVLGNAISGSGRHRSYKYCERCRYLEDRVRELEAKNARLERKLDDYRFGRMGRR